MKIGAMINGFRRPTFAENLEVAATLGIDGVQFYVSDDLPDEVVKDHLDRIKDKGMVFSALCGDIGGYDDPDANKEKVDRFKRILDLSKKLECGIVTTHIGKIPEDTTCVKYNTMFEACKSIADYAASIGATFAIETGPEKAIYLKEFLDKLESKGIGVNLDPANLVMCSHDDAAFAANVLSDYIVHTHAKDGVNLKACDRHKIYGFFATGGDGGDLRDMPIWEYFKEVPLGQGSVDYDAYLAALAAIGHKGYLTIEREVGADPAADIGLAVNFLKEKTAKYEL